MSDIEKVMLLLQQSMDQNKILMEQSSKLLTENESFKTFINKNLLNQTSNVLVQQSNLYNTNLVNQNYGDVGLPSNLYNTNLVNQNFDSNSLPYNNYGLIPKAIIRNDLSGLPSNFNTTLNNYI